MCNMYKFKLLLINGIILIAVFVSGYNYLIPNADKPPGKPNVLFIIADDLKPELGCYGNQVVQSPNIDRIAKRGTVFTRAYCQFPLCGPSRNSFLTGLRPTNNRFVSNRGLVDQEVPQYPTLPQSFKENGYYTISNGKVFHDHGNVIDGLDGWSEIPWEPHPAFFVWKKEENAAHSYQGYQYLEQYRNNPGPSYEAADVPDDAYPTGKLTTKTIYDLHRLKEMDKSFFLAVGYRKPHLPHNSPQRYWDMYRTKEFTLANNFSGFDNIPSEAFHNSGELRHYNDIPKTDEIAKSTWLQLIRAYYANVSYTDAQIGKILATLDELNLTQETIIVVIGDNGYQMSDHGMWSKNNNFHASLQVPFILSVPNSEEATRQEAIVELIDIYPTLLDLCGISKPDHLEGRSLSALIRNQETNKDDENVAFSRVGNGETLITRQYIYTEWINSEGETYEKMLFDLESDPQEMTNVVASPEKQLLVRELNEVLHQHIRQRNQ